MGIASQRVGHKAMNLFAYAAGGLLIGAAVAWGITRYVYGRRVKHGREATLDLQARMEKLEQVRSIFVANVTHELRTPLTSIKGYIELLKSEKRDEETAKRFYDIIDIETERLHTLIEDILQLSEIGHAGNGTRCNQV